MVRGSSSAKRMGVFSSEDKCAQVGTYGAVKQETPLPSDAVTEQVLGILPFG